MSINSDVNDDQLHKILRVFRFLPGRAKHVLRRWFSQSAILSVANQNSPLGAEQTKNVLTFDFHKQCLDSMQLYVTLNFCQSLPDEDADAIPPHEWNYFVMAQAGRVKN